MKIVIRKQYECGTMEVYKNILFKNKDMSEKEVKEYVEKEIGKVIREDEKTSKMKRIREEIDVVRVKDIIYVTIFMLCRKNEKEKETKFVIKWYKEKDERFKDM